MARRRVSVRKHTRRTTKGRVPVVRHNRNVNGRNSKIKGKDNRNLFGGQYRFSNELAKVISSNARIGQARFTHDMDAFVRMNHFDVDRMLRSEGINEKALIHISSELRKGNNKPWNTQREGVLIDGIVKLGKKYKVPLERPINIDSRGNIMIKVKQDEKFKNKFK